MYVYTYTYIQSDEHSFVEETRKPSKRACTGDPNHFMLTSATVLQCCIFNKLFYRIL